ncbi:transcription repressor NadR [Thermosipho ferrireducens]|uniref:Transcription repressor NadR n=1 Tax=Thermosipho ferrireducens TaxID=2571116 RepID=A0ABX7S8J4_9BACT|nr:transcription repressor NadR [Thermosipho ferrireducens]QTA37937.1 transcription repressor NadR [Thermosipho ferrireducens]
MNRLNKILDILKNARGPVKGKVLAEKLGVSRQIIVQDISSLKVKGYKIFSTRDGYILEKDENTVRKMVAVKHTADEIYDELFSIVNAGGKIIDVIVEHPIYGEITGRIDIGSSDDIAKFMSLLKSTGATPLLELSGGIHIHTIEAPDESTMKKVLKAIQKYLIVGGEEIED